MLTQYVLEHVADVKRVLTNLRGCVDTDGVVIHVLNGLVDRHEWYVTYRWETSLLRRLARSVRQWGLWRTLANPFGFTPAHEPRRGDFEYEHRTFRLEKWAVLLFAEGFDIVDYFQTRDVNWVFVTRPRA